MKITAKDLKELGVNRVDRSEVEPAQKKNLETIAGNMKEHMLCFPGKQEEKSEESACHRTLRAFSQVLDV